MRSPEASLVESVRKDREIHQIVKKLCNSRDDWLRQAAHFALKPYGKGVEPNSAGAAGSAGTGMACWIVMAAEATKFWPAILSLCPRNARFFHASGSRGASPNPRA